jgi:hypothetical protein
MSIREAPSHKEGEQEGAEMSHPSPFAVEHIRKMRGGSQAHLMRASDGKFYVIKFQNNPGGIRTLASEFLATKLALCLGLPVAEVCTIEVPELLIAETPELRIEVDGSIHPCAAGSQLGFLFAANSAKDRIFDHIPRTQFHRVVNRWDLIRMLAFDKWAGNCDGRQAVFVKRSNTSGYHMTFIDQHLCFDGHWWSFPDLTLHGTYRHHDVYKDVTGWESFEPILSMIEGMEYADLWRYAGQVPYEWYEYDGEGLFDLVETLYRRRSLVRELITQFRDSSHNPFPEWKGNDRSRICASSSVYYWRSLRIPAGYQRLVETE